MGSMDAAQVFPRQGCLLEGTHPKSIPFVNCTYAYSLGIVVSYNIYKDKTQ